MSLGTICTTALYELSGFEVPSNFYGNQNLTARTCVALVTREGRTLEMGYRWAAMISEYTITTVAGTATYALPTDFRAFANMSFWDRTHIRPMVGPASGHEWQWLKGSIGAGATIDRWFRHQGTSLVIHPTPPASGDTIAFDYYSKNWITKQSDSTNVADWTNDNDTSRLDEDLLVLGLKWRFLQSKGMPFEPEYKEYEAMLDEVRADQTAKRQINLGPHNMRWDGLPETGYGS
jgi:hypothetical protein